jgi:antitoxin (DNA-binding transcriptional repressor) of toxin-antitoxin stability system
MTKTISLDEDISIQTIIALTKNGDEVLIEENGELIAKLTPIVEEKVQPQQKILGLGRGKGYFMSDDFDNELPDEFWGFDKEL